MFMSNRTPSENVDVAFFRDDEYTRKVGKLQEIIYHLEEKNFIDSVAKIAGIGFTSDVLVPDLVQNIIHLSIFYKSKIPLLVRLISELNLKSDIVSEISRQVSYGLLIGAFPFLLALIEANLLDISFKDKIIKSKEEQYSNEDVSVIQRVIEDDDVEKLKEIFSSHDFEINKKHDFKIPELFQRLIKQSMSLIEFAALCGSITCFRFLYINNANISIDNNYNNNNYQYNYYQNYCRNSDYLHRYPSFYRQDFNDHRYDYLVLCHKGLYQYIYVKNNQSNYFINLPDNYMNQSDVGIIHLAILGGNIDIMTILEQAKIQPVPSCIRFAIFSHRDEIFDWLVEQFPENECEYSFECMECSFIHGIERIKQIDPQDAFEAFCCGGLCSLARLLISNFSLMTGFAFSNSCSNGHTEVVKLLLSLPSFDVNTRKVLTLIMEYFYLLLASLCRMQKRPH